MTECEFHARFDVALDLLAANLFPLDSAEYGVASVLFDGSKGCLMYIRCRWEETNYACQKQSLHEIDNPVSRKATTSW